MQREIKLSYVTQNGTTKHIYEVDNINLRGLRFGKKYEVRYRLLNQIKSFRAILVSCTEDGRTLVFDSNIDGKKTIGVPNHNILDMIQL